MRLTANISVPQKNFSAIDLHSDNAVENYHSFAR